MHRPQPVTFLIFDAFGGGGVARTVTNLANLLVEHRDVGVISLFRHGHRRGFDLHPRVRLEVLVDLRAGLGPLDRALHRRPTRLRPTPCEKHLSRLTDRVLRRRLAALQSGVLVSTRPSLHLAATTWAGRGVRLVGQEHGSFPTRFANARQAAVLREVVPALDAYVVLTHADAGHYRRLLPGMSTRVEVIQNALPWPIPETPARLDTKVVVAAGRLAKVKGFDRLLTAFEPVARTHPDWQLHIYGRGPEKGALERRIRRLGLDANVRLQGYADDFHAVLAGGSVFALASRSEGFALVLIEAMSTGLPMVSFDCPHGPGEIVDDGRNGFLVPDDDVEAFTEGLRMLVEDDELRARFGKQAVEDARRYAGDVVVGDWLALFDHL